MSGEQCFAPLEIVQEAVGERRLEEIPLRPEVVGDRPRTDAGARRDIGERRPIETLVAKNSDRSFENFAATLGGAALPAREIGG